ncbi:MAG: MFS transporter [Legionella sp.]|nr:MAG: MFS transporter [Legionella sp.]PJD98462.1 MAG: MFS transporter [Legionella sp.]
MQLAGDFRGCNDKTCAFLLPWIVCLAATMFFFYEFIQGNMFASIASNIMQDFHIEADKMAYLSSIYYLSNVLFLFVAGLVLDRYSIKNTLLFAMSLCVISTIILACSSSFSVALLCRFLTGIGSAFCFLGPVRLASYWFPPKKMAFVTGIIVTVAMTGGMMAQYPLTKLVSYVGWRQAVLDVGMLGFFLLVFMAFGIKEKKTEQTAVMNIPEVLLAAKKAYFNPQYLRAALFASLMNMAIAVFGAMMGNLYLEQRLHVSSEQAALVNGMLFLGAILGSPLLGFISDKAGLRVLPMKISALASIVTVLAVLYVPVSVIQMAFLFFLLGLFTSAQVISYALVAESSSSSMTATAVSVVSIVTQGGYLVYQNIFSKLLIHSGAMELVNGIPIYSLTAYQQAALILPLGLFIAFFVLFGLKETYCQQTGK